jgi:sulfotransferase
MKNLHLIAGLPRSGSTLLSSILNQNPSFSAGISDPLNEALVNVVRAFSVPGVFTQCSEEQNEEKNLIIFIYNT